MLSILLSLAAMAQDSPEICDTSVPQDHATVQAAADASPDGAVVCIGEGTFVGTVVLDSRDLTFVGSGSGRTVLDAAGAGSVVRASLSTAELTGLTLRGGNADGGGGLSVFQSTVWLEDVVVSDNLAFSGAGINATQATVIATDVRIVRNRASGPGGGISLGEAVFDGYGVRIAGNTAVGSGGGVYATRAGLSLFDSAVMGNRVGGAQASGGGLALWNAGGTMQGTIFANNRSAGVGGAMSLSGYTVNRFENVVIAGNAARVAGGGAHVSSMGYEAEFVNAAFVGNQAARGGAAWVEEYAYGTFSYSDFWDNSSDVEGPGIVTLGDGLLYADPQFGSRYVPTDGSPLIDAGDPAILDADGSRSDIGAYGGP